MLVNAFVISALIYELQLVKCNSKLLFMRLTVGFSKDQSVNDNKNRQTDCQNNSDFRGYQGGAMHGVWVVACVIKT